VYRKMALALFVSMFMGSSVSLAARTHPELIVVIVVDQMRADYLERFAPYETGGLHFLATEGADFVNANYQHSPTETCVGHAVLLSGRNPVHTGIVANRWYDRSSGSTVYCVDDSSSPVLDGAGNPVSPRNLIGDNFSDWLQTSYPGARVYSISLKDRAAIPLGGHHPQGAFWFDPESGRFVTSRYYAEQLPQWVMDFNHRHQVDSYARKEWVPLLDDSSPAYHTHEVASQFPHSMPEKIGPKLYGSVYASPFGDELLEAFAEATVAANHLGEIASGHGASDLLAISFSSNDAVGHAYGPDSPEIADEQIRLDRTLGRLVAFLDSRVGNRNILWVLSADHGSEPTPEAEREFNHNSAAQRLPISEALGSTQKQLDAIFQISGEMDWFAATIDTMLYFNRTELARHHISLAAARRALAEQVHNVPGIAGFYDTSQLPGVPGWIGSFLRNSSFPDRSGDVYYLTEEWTCFSSQPTGTSHGDPWPYDTHVPLVIAGWRIQPKRITASVQLADLAPTLADLLAVHWPRSEPLDGQSRKDWLAFGSQGKLPH
jgi:predicted AlkP superfamily pyrophosphatase or phosphodiesterase